MSNTTFKQDSSNGRDYKTVCYTPSRDANLSARAKGVLYYLLLRPPNWVGHIYDITANFADKEYTIKQAVKELVVAGYMKLEKLKKNGRYVGSQYVYSERPIFKNK
jgi:predicted transcriptional regulator